MYMLMTCTQKKAPVREEVWGSPGPVENRLAGEQGDSWGGITSYNLLDLQVTRTSNLPPLAIVYLGPVSKQPTQQVKS